jgi:hypothetical protein
MNGTFPMPSLSNSIIVFASFYQIGSGLAIVAVVPPGTRKRGKVLHTSARGMEWQTRARIQ